MRPPAIEKMGYYPTPEIVLETLKTYATPEDGRGRLLDPCAGEGKAAGVLGHVFDCETWGAELSPERAAKAAQVMNRVYNAPWQVCQLNDETITVLFLNPPYETDRFDTRKRLEYDFLKSTTPKLVRGGLLIYVIPQKVLGIIEVARLLANSYECLTVSRFPDREYETFKQVVVLGTRRKINQAATDKEILAIQAMASEDMPVLEPLEEPVYHLLPAPERGANGKPVLFKRSDWEPEEIVEATRANGVHRSKEWLDLLNPTRGKAELTFPVMPLKKGHIAMLMASGMMGTVRLTDEKGRPMLIKGRVVKVVEKVDEHDNGDGETVTEVYRDRFITTIAVLNKEGIQIIKDVKGLADFMRAHGDKIAAHVLQTYRPLYNLDPTPTEIAVLDTLGKGRKALPGQSEPGLLSTQRHAAAAVARCIRKNCVANIQAEMGCGKTSIASGAIEILDAYPALILCPPHLVPKWIREIEEVIPGAQARELRRIGRSGDERADVNDVRSFLNDWQSGRLGKKAVAVMANTSAKIGPGWEPAVILRNIRDPLTGSVTKVCVCPSCGAPVYGDEGAYITNPEELTGKRRFCRAAVPGWQLGADGRLKLDEQGNTIWGTRPCNTPLFRFSGARRWSLAEYIVKHAKGAFKLLCADESHEYKGKSSDRGIAFHQLITACQSTLTLTGTFFGGRSTSIFWLLHRLNANVRHDFAFHDEKRWARLYGVLESTRRRRRNDDADGDGVFTGNRRYRNQAKEQPGVSPAIVNRLLDTTVFLSLKDLGLALPEYKEEVSSLTMLDDQAQQYHQMDGALKSMALQSSRYLSTWLQWSLARPNSAFRDETIIVDELNKKGEVIRHVPLMELPAINPNGHRWLPKEGWLANFCRAEKLQGRKVLVYVRQTGKRDIQDHLVLPLEENGLRVTVLGGNVDPRKREEWIAKRADRLDVLICNAELVKTGLDLIQFSSVVFYEITYSLYTLWQAVRRVWRLGQVRPVRAVFSVYNGTMEARALGLMGAKMKAAQLLYGDEVGGTIVPQEDGDLLTELAREVLNGADLPDLQTLFADEMKVSNNPLGSLTTPSAVILPGEKVLTWSDWMAEKVVVVRRKSRKEVVPEGQMGLGI
ncbi:MAG TPA: DUF6094 domain-containing protein [Bellilinea sp.]|nr:DUF6094 domain-containing protein [Bellilinea sp.]